MITEHGKGLRNIVTTSTISKWKGDSSSSII